MINEPAPENQASPINPNGEKAPGAVSEPSAASLAAGNAAFAGVAADVAARKRGRPPTHGRYIGEKREKGKRLPLAALDNGSNSLLLEDEPTDPIEMGGQPLPPAFDEKVNREMAAVVVTLLERCNLFLKHKKLTKKISEELATFVIEHKEPMPKEPRDAIEGGIVLCAKKYNFDLAKTPEGMLFLGLLTWKMADAEADKRLIAKYWQLRPAEKPPEKTP